jgi:hypothetical protein
LNNSKPIGKKGNYYRSFSIFCYSKLNYLDLTLTLLPRKIISHNEKNENNFVNSGGGNSLNSMFNAANYSNQNIVRSTY